MTAPIAPEIIRSAAFSLDRTYRFRLGRCWGGNGRQVAFCLCNPSTADADEEDATSRRGIAFAQSWGMDELVFVNINPFCSTDPKLQQMPSAEALIENDYQLRVVATEADIIVAAWGDGALPGLGRRALDVFVKMHRQVWCLHRTKKGNPGHPLYLPASSAMKLYASA